jgi:predicted extracellular nuclease
MDYSVKESAMRGPGLTLLWSVFCLCSLFLVVPVAGHCDSGLFISEYVEGTGLYNRALELYNAAPREINTVVDEIRIEFYSDGMTQPRSTLIEGAGSGVVIPPGECHVIVHWSADAELLAYADETAIVLGDFDGNDAIVVKLNGVVVDVFGQVGFDPTHSHRLQW